MHIHSLKKIMFNTIFLLFLLCGYRIQCNSTKHFDTCDKENCDDDEKSVEKADAENLKTESVGYSFTAYSDFFSHENLLKDYARTNTFRDAIYHNYHLFEGKIVMDIGSGTGILSLFAARVGAKKVIAIEQSNIAILSKKIISDNKMDEIIEVIHEKLENVKKLPNGIEKVDIIISAYMGVCLLNENLLSTVLYARDKWLAKGGIIFPDKANIYLAGAEFNDYKEEHINWWENVYGFNFTELGQMYKSQALIDTVPNDKIVTDHFPLKEYDLYTLKKEDIPFNTPFYLNVLKDDYITTLVAYFTVEFYNVRTQFELSTGPYVAPTIWKQTLFILNENLLVKEDDVVSGSFEVKLKKNVNRKLEFNIKVQCKGKTCDHSEENAYFIS